MNEPVWIDRAVVLDLHTALFCEFGGCVGVRDTALLDSALARPRHLWSYASPDLFGLTASSMHGIVQTHPFVDGNKRLGFAVGGIFLEKNGKTLKAAEADATTVMRALTVGTMKEHDLAVWLRPRCE